MCIQRPYAYRFVTYPFRRFPSSSPVVQPIPPSHVSPFPPIQRILLTDSAPLLSDFDPSPPKFDHQVKVRPKFAPSSCPTCLAAGIVPHSTTRPPSNSRFIGIPHRFLPSSLLLPPETVVSPTPHALFQIRLTSRAFCHLPHPFAVILVAFSNSTPADVFRPPPQNSTLMQALLWLLFASA